MGRFDLIRLRLGIAGTQQPQSTGTDKLDRHPITRLRHETRQRRLTVASIEQLTPRMLRFDFTCPDFGDFVSASPDDHVKLFFPDPNAAEGAKPPMRDFTPRTFDVAAGTIEIDFALHEAGPATSWAAAARVGDLLEIGGPRGSVVVADDFDWYLLIGDETALPAIGRRVEQLRAGARVATFVTVDHDDEAQSFDTPADWVPNWIIRDGATDDAVLLRAVLDQHELPAGDGFVWIAAEASVAREVRSYMLDVRNHPRAWVKAAGYWKRGEGDAHEKIED